MRIHQNGVSTPLRRGVFMKYRKVVCSKRLQSLRYESKVSCSNRLKSPRAKTLGEKRGFCKNIEIKKGFRTRRKPHRIACIYQIKKSNPFQYRHYQGQNHPFRYHFRPLPPLFRSRRQGFRCCIVHSSPFRDVPSTG